jgi:hypothetical protein
MRFWASLLFVGAILWLAQTASATGTSGLRGLVTRGPITPICMVEQPCDEPAAGVKLAFLRAGQIVQTARTDENGKYRVVLRPGAYSVRVARTAAIGRGLTPRTVRVVRGRFLRVDFSIDTGIR